MDNLFSFYSFFMIKLVWPLCGLAVQNNMVNFKCAWRTQPFNRAIISEQPLLYKFGIFHHSGGSGEEV